MKFSRRQFIKSSFYGISTLAGIPMLPQRTKAQTGPIDCLILGAGISGLVAAYYLKPYKNVMVLEGSSRIGGRMYTVNDFTDGPVELGAEYIHIAPQKSLLWNDVKKFNLPTVQIDKFNAAQIFHRNWGELKSLYGAAFQWNPLAALFLLRNVDQAHDRDISAAQWLNEQNYSEVGRDIAQMVLNGHLPADLSNLSLKAFHSDNIIEQLQEPYDYHIPTGFNSLLKALAQDINIEVNCPVEKISYNSSGVTVWTTNGKVFRAKTAICTFSVNMLKSQRVQFSPQLPRRKLEALQIIEQGYQSKVVIEFTEQFWSQDTTMFHRCDSTRQAGKTYFNIGYGEKRAPLLTALIGGPDAKRLNGDSDEVVLRKICQDLDEMFPQAAPVFGKIKRTSDGSLKYLRYQWQDDPFAKGGVSYLSMNRPEIVEVTQARYELANSYETAPLFWAGEASATKTQPSSVHGAYSTGLRAAAEVLAVLR